MPYKIVVNVKGTDKDLKQLSSVIASIIKGYTGEHPTVQINNKYKNLKKQYGVKNK